MNPIDTTHLSSIGLGAPSTAAGEATTQDTFLTLMLAQLKHQDPFEPLENGEFLSQIAAFETATGVRDLMGVFDQLSSALHANQTLQAAALVERTVLAELPHGMLAEGGTLAGAVVLPASSARVSVEIADPAGRVVRRMDLGSQPAGQIPFTWDGLDDSDRAVPPGAYVVSAHTLVDGAPEEARTLLAARVESVSFARDGGETTLQLAGGIDLRFSEISQIM